jgi:hypothetical protein
VPFGSVGHVVHVEPQALASSSAAHVLPHRCRPVAQVNAQLPLVHELLAAPVGRGHGVHRVPQEFGLVSDAHTPLQLCVPAGHCPAHDVVASMQAPLHSFCVAGQIPPHTPAVQVAVPPVMSGHGVQEVPQLAGSVSFRHFFTSSQ